jgi:hypothetical protein
MGVAVALKAFYREPTIEGLQQLVAAPAIARAA